LQTPGVHATLSDRVQSWLDNHICGRQGKKKRKEKIEKEREEEKENKYKYIKQGGAVEQEEEEIK